ncbi:MAG: amino acid adenylation domain-containing protein [Proteobacteria bacterium]|nr:amino acid adenylation domain-containing protein [Pseudomonadota bacterium]
MLDQIFSCMAEKHPENAAVISGNARITYQALNTLASRIQSAMAAGNIYPNGKILTYLPPGIPFIGAILGILKSGSSYVPVDINDPFARTRDMAEALAPDLIITSSRLRPKLGSIQKVRFLVLDEATLEITLAPESPNPPPVKPGIRNPVNPDAYIIHTSGSTGIPKGIAISHRAVINLMDAFDREKSIGPEDRCSLWSSLNFDVSIYEIWSALLTGACLYIPEDPVRFSPLAFMDFLETHRITSAYVPPFMLSKMAAAPGLPLGLKRMLTGVDPIPESLLHQIKTKIPGLCLINGYGPAEATVCATLYTIPSTLSRPGNAPIGKPIQNLEIHLLDEAGLPVKKGEKGEICIKGIQVASGYLGNPGLSAEKFVRYPFSKPFLQKNPDADDTGTLMYKTGDKGFWLEDGNLMFAGRMDFQIKHRGVRIEPGEIENTLIAFPGISQAAVVLKQDPPHDKVLTAYVDGMPDTAAVFDFLRSKLPRTLLPSAVIGLKTLPQTPQGKIDRNALIKRKDKGTAPDDKMLHSEKSSQGPTPFQDRDQEAQIGKIWEQVLGKTPISPNDNFYLLGGDSILGVKIVSRINQLFKINLHLNELFDSPELKAFSCRVTQESRSSAKAPDLPDSPGNSQIPKDRLPLLPDQQLIWMFEQLTPGTPVYHIPLVYRISGKLDLDRLKAAIRFIQNHNTSLDTVFFLENDQPCQAKKPYPLEFTITQTREMERPVQQEWIRKQVETVFDLENGPLFRTAVLTTKTQESILCFTFHHLIFDGWSAGLFVRELNRVYGQLVLGNAVQMKDQGMSYPGYVISQTHTAAEKWQAATPFFTRYLKDLPQNSPATEGFEARVLPLEISADQYQQIKKIAREHNTSAFAVLLSFFQILLFTHTHEDDQVTGIAHAGRNLVETESLIGFLMNTLVARNRIHLDMTFDRFLTQVKKNLDTLFQYGHIPFQRISKFCREQGRDSGPTSTVFQSLFLMQTMAFPNLDLLGTQSDYVHFKTSAANTDITLELYEKKDGVTGWFKYRTQAFSAMEMEHLATRFMKIMENALAQPESTLDTIMGLNTFPLSPMQHGMLMETLRAPQGAGCYVEQILFSMDQEIDFQRFTRAWERIIAHHDILRLGFTWKGLDYPEQCIAPIKPLKIEYNDWSSINASEKKEYLDMFLKADRRLGFPLYKPPAFRVALFKTNARRYTCIWSFHHCIADGRSMVFILRDLFLAYQNPAIDLAPAGSFKHYILWLTRQKQTMAKKFWAQYLKGFNKPLVFPFRMQKKLLARKRRQQHAIPLATGLHEAPISPITARKLKEMCQENDITLNSFLMGAWAILLSHYTGNTDILFGATISVRNFEQSRDDKTGMYINTVPVRIRIQPDQPLIDFVSGIRKQWQDIRKNEHLSLTDIHALSPIQGTLPLSEIYFSYDYHSLDAALSQYKGAISCSRISLFERTPAAIFLAVQGTDDMVVSIEYDQRKFNAQTTRQILDHFAVFLKSASENPGACLMELPILTETEKTGIAEKLNTLQRHLKPRSCIHHLFEIQASINRKAPAVTDGQQTLSYEQLNAFANQIALFLITKGGGPEKKVLLLLEQNTNLIAVLLGVLKSGCCYIPLDITYPKERTRQILKDAGPDIIITTDPNLNKLGNTTAQIVLMDRDLLEIKQMATLNPSTQVTPDNMAYIIYTSGSTGVPKGVIIEHSALVSFTRAATDTYDIGPSDRVLQFASISFDASAEEIYPTLFSGATLVIKPRELVQTPAQFFDFCRIHQLTVIDLPTAYWHMIADQIHTLAIPDQLRLVIIGGEEANLNKVRHWQAHIADDIRLVNTYGPTETTVAITFADLSHNNLEAGQVPIGIPFPRVSLCILNHFNQPAPPGIRGELYIGGPQIARGYLNRDAQTRKAFVTIDALPNKDRFFKTGDHATMLSSGQVIFLGRIDRQIKIRGFRVEPGEIEKTALAHDQIKAFAIVVSRDADDNLKTIAFMVPADGETLNFQDFKLWMQERLPEYMVPSALVSVKALPHTASGKIDYTALEKILSETSGIKPDTPDKDSLALTSDPRIPENQFQDRYETNLKEIWETILKTTTLGPTDNFFEIGGSSLTAIRLATAIEKKFNISIPVLAIFKFPVLRELAHVLRKKDVHFEFTNIKIIREEGENPPIFFIAGTNEDTQAYRHQDLKGHPFYTVTVFAHKTINQRIIPMDLWEIARNNVTEILQANPTGPYIIIGFCRYSIAAFEIASQLAGMGKTVERLVLIDEFWQKKGLSSFVGHHLKGILRFGLGHVLKKIIPKTKEKLHMYSLALDNKKERFYIFLGRPVPEALQFRLMESSFWKAYESYMPLPYTGDAIVLDTRKWKEKFDPQLRNYIQGELIRIEVAATHRDWFKPTQINTVIDALERPEANLVQKNPLILTD